jgi:opacity protein-like surface antigen
MKTKVLFTALITALLFPFGYANAQIEFGVKAGGTLSTQSELGELWNNADVRQGIYLGVMADYRITDRFSVQTEINYLEKGMKYDRYIIDRSYNISRKYDYLNIPLLAKGTFGNKLGLNEPFSTFAYAGPYYSILLSSKDSFSKGESSAPVDLTSSAKSSDFGAIFGLGASYKLPKKGELYIDLRYEMGLISIDTQDNDLRNKTVEAGIGFRF